MERLELYGHINEIGEFIPHNRPRFNEWARRFPGKEISVRFERKSTKRSDPQNRYYWGCVIKEIAIRLRDLGHDWLTDEDVHDMMKLKFNHEQIISEEGEVLELPKSTANLTKTQFGEYIDRIRMWAADFLEINIPDPGVQTEMQL
jgi:hypothetical protein